MSARAGGQFGRAAENLADLRTAVVAEQEPEGLLGVVLDQDAVQFADDERLESLRAHFLQLVGRRVAHADRPVPFLRPTAHPWRHGGVAAG